MGVGVVCVGCVFMCMCVKSACPKKHMMYMMLWFNYNVMNVVNVVMFHFAIISNTNN